MGMFKYLCFGCISKHYLLTFFPLLFDCKGVGFNNNMLNLEIIECPGKVLTVDAVTYYDDMIIQ